MTFADHTFDLPLDHDGPDGERITGYAREVTADPSRPWLLFLGGGPGFPAPRPLGDEGWLLRALRDYRVLLLDARDPAGRARRRLPRALPGGGGEEPGALRHLPGGRGARGPGGRPPADARRPPAHRSLRAPVPRTRVRAEFPEFDVDGPVYFTGEMIYPWMQSDALRPVADELAERPRWSRLYDTDMYVNRDLSLRTTSEIRGIRVWQRRGPVPPAGDG